MAKVVHCMTDEEKYKKAMELLKRWDKVEIPGTVFIEPGEDFLLPMDTQEFLKEYSDDTV